MNKLVIDWNIDTDSVLLNQETLLQMDINSNILTLHFGALTKTLNIITDETIEKGTIKIPQRLTGDILIPELPYEFYYNSDHLYIGPVIGLLIVPKYYEKPELQMMRFSNYDKVNGLIYLFKQDSINAAKRTITGYYYNPRTKGFVLSTLPYPSVIFNRTAINTKLFNHLRENIGNKIFNYPFGNIDKWEFWDRISKQTDLKNHLPHTKEYKGVQSVIDMLKLYDGIYLKPATLGGGYGILRVKKLRKGFSASTRYKSNFYVQTKKGLALMLRKKLRRNLKYTIQQEIPFYHEGHKVDFRVYMQKNGIKDWEFTGIEAKVAKKGSIISNSKNRERMLLGKDALKEIYHLGNEEVEEKIEEISKICVSILAEMEKYITHIGEVAIDVLIDKNHKVWILEVQLNFAAEIKLNRTEDEQKVLPIILPKPLEYAKSLAGF